MKSFVHEQTLDDLVIGYFEFNGNELTGSYGYTISKFGEVSAQVHDNLPDDNAITSTAYGILSATELTGNDVPSHILENAHVQKVSAASLGIEGLTVTGDGMYWFYEYDPSTLYEDSANTITRTSSAGVWKPWENAQASSQYKKRRGVPRPDLCRRHRPRHRKPVQQDLPGAHRRAAPAHRQTARLRVRPEQALVGAVADVEQQHLGGQLLRRELPRRHVLPDPRHRTAKRLGGHWPGEPQPEPAELLWQQSTVYRCLLRRLQPEGLRDARSRQPAAPAEQGQGLRDRLCPTVPVRIR